MHTTRFARPHESDAVSYQGSLRSAPVRMLPRVCAPAQPLEVEVPSVAEEVPQLGEKLSDTCRNERQLCAYARTAGSGSARCIWRRTLSVRATRVMTSCSSLNERLSLIHSLTMAKTGRHRATRFKDFWRIDLCPLYPPKADIGCRRAPGTARSRKVYALDALSGGDAPCWRPSCEVWPSLSS